MWWFDPDIYNFWPLYDAIKKYYPLGVPKDETRIYYSYPGIKALEELVTENILLESPLKIQWNKLEATIRTRTKLQLIGTTFGQAPSLSSYLELEKKSPDNLTRRKELHYLISLLGPFYTAVGEDKSDIRMEEVIFHITNYVVVSPVREFAANFELVCNCVEEQFRNYRFVPYSIYAQQIEGLHIGYSAKEHHTVFSAIFNDLLNIEGNILGDRFFRSESWVEEGREEKAGWTTYPSSEET